MPKKTTPKVTPYIDTYPSNKAQAATLTRFSRRQGKLEISPADEGRIIAAQDRRVRRAELQARSFATA